MAAPGPGMESSQVNADSVEGLGDRRHSPGGSGMALSDKGLIPQQSLMEGNAACFIYGKYECKCCT